MRLGLRFLSFLTATNTGPKFLWPLSEYVSPYTRGLGLGFRVHPLGIKVERLGFKV